jgi:hypothetical protein
MRPAVMSARGPAMSPPVFGIPPPESPVSECGDGGSGVVANVRWQWNVAAPFPAGDGPTCPTPVTLFLERPRETRDVPAAPTGSCAGIRLLSRRVKRALPGPREMGRVNLLEPLLAGLREAERHVRGGLPSRASRRFFGSVQKWAPPARRRFVGLRPRCEAPPVPRRRPRESPVQGPSSPLLGGNPALRGALPVPAAPAGAAGVEGSDDLA